MLEILALCNMSGSPSPPHLSFIYVYAFFFFGNAELSDSDIAEYVNLSFYSLLCVFFFHFPQVTFMLFFSFSNV